LPLKEAFNMPSEVIEPLINAHKRIGLGSHLPARNYVGYEGGLPVACASIFLGKSVVGVYCVGTIRQARGKGYATAVVAHMLREARASGYRYGILQASELGHSVYLRMGFRDVSTVSLFTTPPSG